MEPGLEHYVCCLRTAVLLLFTNQGVRLQHLWFSSISYWTSLCLVSAGSCLFNEQRSSSARQYFLLFRILISQTKVNRSARQHRSTISSGSFTRSGKLSLSCQSCLSARNDSYQFIIDDQLCFVLHIVCCMNTAFIIHLARSRQVYIEWLEATVLSSTTCV